MLTHCLCQPQTIKLTSPEGTKSSMLPDLGMVLLDGDGNPITHTLRAKDYINIETGGQCSIMIHQSDNWILGIPYWKRNYIVFNLENETIEITPPAQNTQPTINDLFAQIIWWASLSGLVICVISLVYEKYVSFKYPANSLHTTSASNPLDVTASQVESTLFTSNYSEL